MYNLDNIEDFKNYDKGEIITSLRLLPDQFRQTWEDVQSIKLPASFRKTQNVVICGMGGSALGGRVVDSLFSQTLRGPIEVFTEYDIPNYVDEKSLVIISSYSGNTEETLSSLAQAIDKKAQVFIVSTGGKLGEIKEKQNLAGYIIEPKYNPSSQPRLALGYSIGAILSILAKTNYISFTNVDVSETEAVMAERIKTFIPETPETSNLAKTTARKFRGKLPVLVGSEHLVGILHAFKNQLNETSKTFSVYFDIPELNHHLLEGLKNPAAVREHLYFIFFESELYTKNIKKRYPITKEIVEKNGIETAVYKTFSDKKVGQVFEILVFGSFVSFYLAFLYREDPLAIDWVDYFKEKLER